MKRIWILYIFTFFQCFCLQYKGIDSVICKALSYVSFILVFSYSLFIHNKRIVNDKYEKKTKKIFHIIAVGITFSIIPACLIEDQPFIISVMTTIGFIFVMLDYDILRRLRIDPEAIERLFVFYGFVYVGIVIVNFLTFPNMIFGSGELDLERGGIRMRSNMLMFGVLSFFYFINKYLNYKKWTSLVSAFIMFVAVASSFFRVYIILMLGLAALMLFLKTTGKRRVAIILSIIVVLFLIIPRTSIYKNLVEVSETQKELSDNSKEDVRIQATRYFVIESQTGIESILLGHGMASYGNSEYGKREELRADNTGFYQADVGWAGCFYDFGLITVLGFMSLLLSGIFRKKNSKTQYLTYFFLFYFLGAIANGHFQYTMLLYILPLAFYVLNYYQLAPSLKR